MSRIFLVLMLLTSALAAQSQITTPPSFNSGAGGIMFDVASLGKDRRLTGISTRFVSPGLHVVDIYYATNGASFAGHENDPSLWTKAATTTVSTSVPHQLTRIPADLNIPLEAGTNSGIYITCNTALNYQVDTEVGGLVGSNGELSIYEGVGKVHAFGATFGSTGVLGTNGRSFRGILEYADAPTGLSSSLSTTGSGTSVAGGVTFDVEARHEDVVVNGIELALAPVAQNIQVWTTKSSVSQSSTTLDSSDWRLVGTAENFDQSNATAKLPVSFEVVVPGGETRGFYVTTDTVGGITELTGTSAGNPLTFSDDQISLHTGRTTTPNFGVQNGYHGLHGAVHYRTVQHGSVTPGSTGMITPMISSGAQHANAVYYDLFADDGPLVIEEIEAELDVTGTYDYEVWAVTGGGSHIGVESDASAWTRISIETITGPVSGRVTIAQDLRLMIPHQGVQGIYLACTDLTENPFEHTFDAFPSNFAFDGTLTAKIGSRGVYPFNPMSGNPCTHLGAVHYKKLGAGGKGFYASFAQASGLDAPPGWINSFEYGDNEKLDGWRFDNPGNRPVTDPLSAPVAICDSDESGTNNPVAASLITPSFTAAGKVELSFEHFFRQYSSSVATVDVWDGTQWNNVATYTSNSPDPDLVRLDITSACGGSAEAMVRFRYTGNFDWYWIIDNVHVVSGGRGQRPQLGIGEFNINDARELHGQPVSSGLPGRYLATADIFSPTIFSWDGEPNQPIQLFVGALNLGHVGLDPQGQLDVGSYDPVTNTFPGILILADGTANDLLNAAFRTSNGGHLTMPLYLPPYTVGQTYHFQSIVYSSTQNIALTNVVSLSVQP